MKYSILEDPRYKHIAEPKSILFQIFSFIFDLVIFIANNIAKNNKIAADNVKNSKPYSSKEFENLFDISEPNIAPREPPAIITP